MRPNKLHIHQIFLCLLLIGTQYLSAQTFKREGTYAIKTYTSEDYKASEQNWAVIQNNDGIVYVGNSTGILEFDGVRWKTITLPNQRIVRNFTKDSKGRIYVGGYNEIGYIEADSAGNSNYVSLIPKLDEKHKQVYHIFRSTNHNDTIAF